MLLLTESGKTERAARFSLRKVDKLGSPRLLSRGYRQLAPAKDFHAKLPGRSVALRDIPRVMNRFVERRELQLPVASPSTGSVLQFSDNRAQTCTLQFIDN